MKFQPGDQIYKYQLIQHLGGNFGEVWLARDAALEKEVAVKILDDSEGPIIDHLLEARIGNKFAHDNLVRIYLVDMVELANKKVVIIVMDYLPEGSITNKVNAANFIDLPRALDAIRDVLRGLEILHESGYYHGDIKPQNIMIGPKSQSMLGDYGITCQSSDGEEVDIRQVYRPHAAPEVFATEKISRQTDIYQTGLTAFRLINGLGSIKNKYQSLSIGDFQELVENGRVVVDTDYMPYVPSRVRQIINKAISVDPKDRYQSAIDMRRALEAIHYPGYWSVEPNGKFVGKLNDYEYTFEEIIQPKSRCTFVAEKLNTRTGRKNKVSRFNQSGITLLQMRALKKKFMLAVGDGSV